MSSHEEIELLSQPLLTEEGFLNEACMNELGAAIKNMPPDYERLAGDPEWSEKGWVFSNEISGALAMWSVRQLIHTAYPTGLEQVIGYLDACIMREFKRLYSDVVRFPDDLSPMANLSLCDINRMLHDILDSEGLFKAWNTEACLGDDWLDLHALLRNVCLTIRTERRERKRFDEEFEKKWANTNGNNEP